MTTRMRRAKRIGVVIAAAGIAACFLGACVTPPNKPDSASPDAASAAKHFDVTYQQFVLTEDGKKPYDLTFLPQLAQQCGATAQVKARAGGVAILGSVLLTVIGKVAGIAVTELGKLVDAQIAKYSIDMTGKDTRVGFYSPDLWWSTSDDASRQYSCFLIVVHACAKSGVDKEKNVCSYAKGDQANVMIVGQYKLTAEDLQVRPLYVRVRGFDAKRNDAQKQVSIAATLKFKSVWWDGHDGHTESLPAIDVFSMKFTPTSGADGDPGKAILPPQDPKSLSKVIFKDWSDLTLLPRPPRSAGSDGTVTVTPEIAETNAPPEALNLIKKVLGGNSTQISNALQSALKSLCGKDCTAPASSTK
jgi:hypothetical protein